MRLPMFFLSTFITVIRKGGSVGRNGRITSW